MQILTEDDIESPLVDINGCLKYLGLSRAGPYELFKKDELRRVWIGKRAFILRTDLSAFIQKLVAERDKA